MLRRILLASAGAIALTSAAVAADLGARPPPPVFLPPPPIFSWTGLYLGGQLGYVWGTDNGAVNDFEFDPETNVPSTFNFAGTTQTNPNGAIGGAHVGYNWQMNQFVLGVEANVDATNLNGQQSLFNTLNFFDEFTENGELRNRVRSTIQGSFRGRIGWALDRWLIYGTGGIAFTDFTRDYQGAGDFSEDIFQGEFDSRTRELVGWTVGGGLEWALNNNWIFGVEYRYTDFGHFTDTGLFGTGFPVDEFFFPKVNVSHHLTENQVQARVSYKFDWFNPAPVVAKY